MGQTKMLLGGHNRIIRHNLFRIKYTELNEIFAFMSLRSLSLSLISIFIPIYLYRMGVTLREIFILFGTMYSVELITEYFTAINIKKFGPKHLIAFSVPILVLHIIQLLTLSQIAWPLWSISLTGGLSLGMYWQSYHYDFSRSKHRRQAGREVGKLYILLTILGATMPAIGGLFSNLVGFPFTLGLSIAVLLLATATLFKTADDNFRPGKIDLHKIKLKKVAKDLAAYAGENIEIAGAGIIWPLFIFSYLNDYIGVGLVATAAAIFAVVVTYYVSTRSDKGKRGSYLRFGGYLNGILGCLKALATTVPRIVGIGALKSIAYSVQASPFVSEYYLHADEESRSEYIYLMESVNDLSKIIFMFSLAVLTYFLDNQQVLVYGLIIAGGGAFLSTLMPPAECEICGEIKNKKIKMMRKI